LAGLWAVEAPASCRRTMMEEIMSSNPASPAVLAAADDTEDTRLARNGTYAPSTQDSTDPGGSQSSEGSRQA
jgi:hypothetical protein